MGSPLSLLASLLWIRVGGSITVVNLELVFLGISINLLLVRTSITSCIYYMGKDILASDSQRGSSPSKGDLRDSSSLLVNNSKVVVDIPRFK